MSAEPLSGGVSSDIWLIRTDDIALVLKRPRRKLKVEADWQAPLDRGASEAAWLEYVSSAVPGSCPRVLGYDEESFAIALEYLDPARHSNWKSDLLAGRVDPAFAGAVGRDLGRIHSASARAPELAFQFDHPDLFESLRVEPYLVRTAAAVPEAREALESIIGTLRVTRVALVHGDVSPKNILAGQHPVFLDAECATWSDPAFDAAFCLTHLTLKQIHLPQHAAALRASAQEFAGAYQAEIDWEEPADVAARVARILPALMLARVEGASPAEYLNPAARDIVRAVALDALATDRPIEDLINQRQGAVHG
ncbi:aminoglycoside phosphotransferase family protein [Microbacterium sp. 2FI]|uniref:phosphotransferase family protein n=1 Tax=Microbacterium sp. 2FI TaxID=2502193 RepID=UPI001484FC12|nr:aminoglycoside phosphotransferase family protein [Microbacterium sp. 2FI]